MLYSIWLRLLAICFFLPLIADQEIRIENPSVEVDGPTPVQAIILDSNGNVTEKEYTYDPNTQTIIINSNDEGDNASIFFPLFETGFLWWGGYWVNYNGYYWNGHWRHVDYDDWNGHWHNYWNHHWDNHWHNYWNQHHKESNFRYKNKEHWQNRSFQGGHRGGNHGGGHEGGHGGGRH